MILDCKSGVCGVLVNASTGERIPHAFWADLSTGDYKAWKTASDGKTILRGPDRKPIEVKGNAPLRFVPGKPTPKPRPGGTPLAEIRQELFATGKAVPIVVLPGQECERPGCHRLASWRVGDEQVVEPEISDGKAYDRGVVTAGHLYCDRHYRPPVQTSVRGVESEVQVVARPQ